MPLMLSQEVQPLPRAEVQESHQELHHPAECLVPPDLEFLTLDHALVVPLVVCQELAVLLLPAELALQKCVSLSKLCKSLDSRMIPSIRKETSTSPS